MNKFKIFSSFVISLLLVLSFFIVVFAAERKGTVPVDTGKIKPLKLSADLVASYVEFFNCPCTIDPSLNTIYVTDKIAVKVGNASSLNAVSAKITVSYYDISTKSTVTVNKTITLNANQWTKVIMVQKPLLIGKSQGVTATIEHTDLTITDPTPANNRTIQKTCGQMVE